MKAGGCKKRDAVVIGIAYLISYQRVLDQVKTNMYGLLDIILSGYLNNNRKDWRRLLIVSVCSYQEFGSAWKDYCRFRR